MATPFAGVQVAGVYRQKVGAFEITVLSDGNLALEATLLTATSTRSGRRFKFATRHPRPLGRSSTSPRERLSRTQTLARCRCTRMAPHSRSVSLR